MLTLLFLIILASSADEAKMAGYEKLNAALIGYKRIELPRQMPEEIRASL